LRKRPWCQPSPEILIDGRLTFWVRHRLARRKPLNLSTFSMDDYAGALEHDTLSPRCILLVEIHASLTNVLGTDGSRVLGSTTAVPSRRPAGGAAAPVASTHEDENEDQLDPDHPVSESTPAPGTESVQGGGGGDDQLDGDEIPYEESELNKLVRLGIAYAKRWDRQAKLKYSESREGWERHLVGALCQRGGPIHMPNFVRIMRHLFAGHPDLPEQDVAVSDEMETGGENGANGDGDGDGDVKPDQTTASEAVAVANGTAASEANSTLERRGAAAATQSGSRQPSREPQEGGDPTDRVEQHYLSLSLEDKLDIIDYLVTLVMGTKVVRTYIEESELRLTELRKQRADVNKERKALYVTVFLDPTVHIRHELTFLRTSRIQPRTEGYPRQWRCAAEGQWRVQSRRNSSSATEWRR
jgi:bromodomain adjacent to zinc finger domain protein 1A